MLTLKKSITKASSVTFTFMRRYWHVVLVLVITSIAATYLAYTTRHMLNPDGVSYVEIARYYSDFDISHAINGYWAPLISWLLAPAIRLGLDPLYTFRALNVALTLFVVAVFLAVLNWRKKPSKSQKLLQAVFVSGVGVLISTWSGFLITPDLLSAAVMLIALLGIARFNSTPSVRLAVAAGVLLAMVYFAKSIGLYVSLILIIFTLARVWIRTRTLPRPYIVLAATFLALVLLWVMAISLKYDKLTVSTAGSYNFSLIGPIHPAAPVTLSNVTLIPHYESDIWAWNDPSYFSMPQWKIVDNLHYYFDYLIRNIPRAVVLLVILSPLTIIGVFVAAQRWRDDFPKFALAAATLLMVAYGMIIVEDRHLWQAALPLLFCAVYYLHKDTRRRLALIVVSATLLFSYIIPNYLVNVEETTKATKILSEMRLLSSHADASIPDGATIAGHELKYIFCYYTRTRCFGDYKVTDTNAQVLFDKMRADGIQYYIELAAPHSLGLRTVHTETLNTLTSLTIYKL